MAALQIEAGDAGRAELLGVWMDVNVKLLQTSADTRAAHC